MTTTPAPSSIPHDPVVVEEALQTVIDYLLLTEEDSYCEYLAENFPQYAEVDPPPPSALTDPAVQHIYKCARILQVAYPLLQEPDTET